VLGAYADRFGRKASLLICIVMMTFGRLAVGLMKGYATIGIAAPIAVILARLLQGFSAGG
jgi:MHS family proline/betaine transporter-like MFS transporter